MTATRSAVAHGRGASIVRHGIAVFLGYPVLVVLIFVLEIWTSTDSELASVTRIIATATTLAVLVSIGTRAALGTERGALAALIVIVGLIVARDGVAIALVIAMILLLALERRAAAGARVRLPWPRIHEAITIFVAVLFVVEVGRAYVASEQLPDQGWATERWSGVQLTIPSSRPDIFVVLLDAHGREDVLRDSYAYDAGPFRSRLETLGFDVATNSRSNYMLTRLSLASMLSGAQLHDLGVDTSAPVVGTFARQAIRDNSSFPLLRRAGYTVTAVSGGYEHIDLRSADRYLDTGQPNELETIMISTTGLGRLVPLVLPGYRGDFVRARVQDELQTLDTLADQQAASPRFVLVHLPVPHWPWVFDDRCEAVPPSREAEGAASRRGGTPATIVLTREQTACADRLVGDAMASLVAKRPDAVVILFSDHGPEEYLDWWAPDEVGTHERSANLFASRTPGRSELFPDDITLVNVLPRLFNAYLGSHLPLAADEVWFGTRPQDDHLVLVDPG